MINLIKLIPIVVLLLNSNGFAQDGTISTVKTFEFDDVNYFNHPTKVRNTIDQTYNMEQVTSYFDPAGYNVTALVKKCVPNPLFGSCQGTENAQGAKELTIAVTSPSNRFNKFKAHFFNPPVGRHEVYINYTLQSPGINATSPLICNSNVGAPTITGKTIKIVFNGLPREVNVEIVCNKFLSRIDYASIGGTFQEAPGAYSNPILMDKISLTSTNFVRPTPTRIASSKLENSPLIDHPICKIGSIIRADNQSLGESIKIMGTNLSLNYFSYRVPGRIDDKKIVIPLSGDSVAGVNQIQLSINIEGRIFSQNFTPASNLSTSFVWDGKDSQGNLYQGSKTANITITYIYSDGTSASATSSLAIGHWEPKNIGLGG